MLVWANREEANRWCRCALSLFVSVALFQSTYPVLEGFDIIL